MGLVDDALTVAFEAHAGQKRRISGAPYVVHVLDVVKFLLYAGAREEVVAAGALHDVLEDTSVSADEVRERFGEEVLTLVRFCTEPGNGPDSSDEEMSRSWRQRKEHAVHSLSAASDEEVLLKLSDSLANIVSLREDFLLLGSSLWQGFRGGQEGNEWYYRSLGEAFSARLPGSRLTSLFLRELDLLFPR